LLPPLNCQSDTPEISLQACQDPDEIRGMESRGRNNLFLREQGELLPRALAITTTSSQTLQINIGTTTPPPLRLLPPPPQLLLLLHYYVTES
jgi:hypothetical protein